MINSRKILGMIILGEFQSGDIIPGMIQANIHEFKYST